LGKQVVSRTILYRYKMDTSFAVRSWFALRGWNPSFAAGNGCISPESHEIGDFKVNYSVLELAPPANSLCERD
jgi:hypothetical protein